MLSKGKIMGFETRRARSYARPSLIILMHGSNGAGLFRSIITSKDKTAKHYFGPIEYCTMNAYVVEFSCFKQISYAPSIAVED